jgi:hypothetical protein
MSMSVPLEAGGTCVILGGRPWTIAESRAHAR